MSFTYTGNLKLALPATGTESGTWGDAVNNQITALVDQSISGTVSLTSMTNANYTLTNGDGNAANEARYMALLVPSSLTLTAARNITVPSTSKMYIVKNSSTGGFSVTVKTAAGGGIDVPNGKTLFLYCDGTNVILAVDYFPAITVNNPTVTNYTESVVAVGTVGASSTLSLTNGTVQTATLTAATPCTFTMPTATAGKSFILQLTQAATSMTTATFTGVKWPSGAAPTITATASAIDIFTFVAIGSTWYGTFAQAFA